MNIAVSPELAAIVRTPPKIERHRFASREQWLKMRMQDVTASSAAALLGIHPYQTAYSLWAVKTGRLSDEIEDSPPLRRGRLLEPVAVQLLREERPDWQLSDYPVGLYFRDPETRLGATPDLLAKNEFGKWGVIQLKSVEPSIFRKDWKDADGNVSPPLWIVIQALIECALTGFEWAAVAPMVVGHGVELPVIDVPLHAGIIDRIKAEVAAFWRIVDEGRTPDVDFGKDGELLALLHAGDERVLNLSGDNEIGDIILKREAMSHDKRELEKCWDENRARLLAKMQGAGAATLPDGRTLTAKRIEIAAHERAASTRIDLRIKRMAVR